MCRHLKNFFRRFHYHIIHITIGQSTDGKNIYRYQSLLTTIGLDYIWLTYVLRICKITAHLQAPTIHKLLTMWLKYHRTIINCIIMKNHILRRYMYVNNVVYVIVFILRNFKYLPILYSGTPFHERLQWFINQNCW